LSDLRVGTTRERLTVWQFFKGLGKVVVGGALLLQAFLFIAVFALLLSILGNVSGEMGSGGGKTVDLEIEEGSALYFDPQGVLSETAPEPDPVEEALNEAFGTSSAGAVSVHELVKVIETAKDDDRISALVLDLEELIVPDIYLSKTQLLADAIEDFREAGKRVVAVSDGYTQGQYFLASEADTVLLHHGAAVFITGYGRYRTYYSSLLDKLDVTKNIFRVGTYKSALEPVLRDDMSPEAKEANEAYLSVLWDAFTSRIDENRELGAGSTDRLANQFPEALRAARGDLGVTMLESGYVDDLVTHKERRDFLVDLVGEDEDGDLNAVGLAKYRGEVDMLEDREDVGNIAVVTVEGAIIDGAQEPGVASGEYVSKQLRKAREDEDVKAVVLRVDSPGGSVYASELIRDEVLAIKEAGKPVVVSMGSLAASGGYWISTPADAIWARETTVTGSIGIFGYIPTFENLANRYGIYTDGVGTTPLAAISVTGLGPLPDEVKLIIQQSIEAGYRSFLTKVSEGRDLPYDRVAEIAEGRVWIGKTAKEIGLVDEFGGLEDAIADAAERAGLEDWDVVGEEEQKSPFEQFIEELTGTAQAYGLTPKHDILSSEGFDQTTLGAAIELVEKETRFQSSFRDPNGVYARCLECTVY